MSEARKKFKVILELEKERNETLKELEEQLGFDVSFSDEMVLENAMDVFMRTYEKELVEKVVSWMK